MPDDAGTIVTVTGRIKPEELGVTLSHEHVFSDMTDKFREPAAPAERARAHESMSLDTFGWVRLHPHMNEDNLRRWSAESAIDELGDFYRRGGDSVVDLSPKGAGFDPAGVREVARATGLRIVHGTAYYVESTHPEGLADRSTDDIEAEFVGDVTEGFDGTDIRAGQIGEIGLSGTITEQEERVLRAAVRAAVRTGASLNIHPPLFGPERVTVGAHDALDIVEDEGLPLDRVVMSHMDQDHHALVDLEGVRRIAERGAYVEFDEWGGWDMYLTSENHAYPSDATRVDAVVELTEAGHADRLLFSHDVCSKMQLKEYGGNGFTHLHDTVLPWLRERGVSDADVTAIMRQNPRRVLTFA